MPPPVILPEPPKVELETVRDARFGEGGFLTLRRVEVVAVRDGGRSAAFEYDMIDRHALDAAVMVAHHEAEGQVWVWLLTSVRVPLALRLIPPKVSGVLWEVPAGLIEPGESPAAAAARELGEELGFSVDASAMVPLGAWTAPAPGFAGELHHYFHVRVDPSTRKRPSGDGSALERDALIVAVPLADALAACRAGEVHDAKTEVALRRLAETLP